MSDSTSQPRQKKVAVLRDRLFVDGGYITEEILEQYRSEIVVGSTQVFDPDTEKTITEPIVETINHFQITQLTADDLMYSFNRGDLDKMYRIFHDFTIVDERVSNPMLTRLKIKFPEGMGWREYQPDAIEAMIQKDYGILKAPPRAGKTLMITAGICLEREKTIVFAHQTDLLVQLYDTFLTFTNLSELQAESGKQIIGFAETLEDFMSLDVVLCTKQTFDHITNKGMLPALQKLFGSVWIDEAHFTAAEVYSKLINRFHAKTRRGVTATPKRKDGLDVIIDGIIGGIVYEITPDQVKQVPVVVERINTGLKLQLKMFSKVLSKLSENETRNKLIVSHMLADVRAGRTIIAVTDRTEHQVVLKRMLEGHGIKVELFNGKTNNKDLRKKILNRIRSGEAPILIAMRNMTTGLDIPRADTFYNLLPSANAVKDGEFRGEGGYEQQCTRIRTEFAGKTKGYIKDFVDSFGLAYSCWNERRKTYEKIGATILKQKEDEPQQQFAMQFMDDGLGD